MTYEEFKQNFLPEFLKIKSFAGRIKYADQYLQRIGSGSGRIVYDIDGEKVLKLAKNQKGVAQNEAEAGAGYYRDTQNIVTIVFDNADDDSWLISEKAKKVTEKRIKEITGIPSLNDLYYFLRNQVSQNTGRGKIFSQDKEMEEFMWENEFASDLIDFVVNYAQSPGDMGRPSTYGEVMRDGQPSIVLTDYGLNDEVYDTHYNPQRKQKYRMYELFNYADGNDDILSDTGDQGDIRRGMWALMPYTVSDGQGVFNEEFVNFVSNRNKYPDKPISNLPVLTDNFHECVNNIKEVLKKVNNKEQFYGNLLELQNYLIRRGFYERDSLLGEEYFINEEIPPVERDTLEDENYANKLAQAIATKLNLSTPRLLGGGANGFAYLINNNLVMKITADVSEADAASKLMRGRPEYIATVFNLYKVVDTETNKAYFVIMQENVPDKPLDKFRRIEDNINEIMPAGLDYGMFLKMIKIPAKFNYDEAIEIAKHVLTDNPELNISQPERQEAYEFLVGMANIRKELLDYQIKSTDYVEKKNLGYKDGVLKFFDTGGYYNVAEPEVGDSNIIELPENKVVIDEKYDRKLADIIANNVAKKIGLTQPKYLDSGENGVAYDIGNDKVLKITKDNSEAFDNLKLINKPLKYIAQPYKVFEVTSKSNPEMPKTYVIILEKLQTNPEIQRMNERLNFAFEKIMDVRIPDVIEYYLGDWDDGKVSKEKVNSYLKKNPKDAEFFGGLLRIVEETRNLGIDSMDYLNPNNLGYKKNGALAFFDVGFGNYFAQPEAEKLEVQEDASAKFTTMDAINQDDFPPYNPIDTSPSINNDLDANIAMYEDLEYNHVVGDATDDEYELTEDRKKSWVSGSKAVEVKKKCRLGGLGNTSVACNQGDINNLEFSSLDEAVAHSQEEIDNFIKDSKVKETVYHGSPVGGLTDFKVKGDSSSGQIVTSSGLREDGMFFTSNPDLAQFYRSRKTLTPEYIQDIKHDIYQLDQIQMTVRNNRDYDEIEQEKERLRNKLKGDVYRVKLKIKNPLVFDAKGKDGWAGWFELKIDLGYKIASGKEVIELIAKKAEVARDYWKYDGIIAKNIADLHTNTNVDVSDQLSPYHGDIYVVFSPDQILIVNEVESPVLVNEDLEISEYYSSLVPDINEGEIMNLQDLPFKEEIQSLGGNIFSVGGAVRDEFLGKQSKDLDVLVTGIPMDELEQVLSKYGRVDAVGKSFGILKFKPRGVTEEIDVAIPRTEKPTGEGGHKGFEVNSSHDLPIEKDLERRDFTINAIAKDIDGNIVDPYGGQKDLKNKVIRVVNPDAFSDDPLRMLRAVQFASRFGFKIEPKTREMIKANAARIKEIPSERILTEFDKIVQKGNPFEGAYLLKDLGLTPQIFNGDGGLYTGKEWEGVQTMGEFLWLVGHHLVQDIAEYCKSKLKCDIETYKELKALQQAFQADDNVNDVVAKTIAHNIYKISPKTLNSKILPEPIKLAAQELLSGKYPKDVSELAVNGNDLMNIGLQGKAIGDAQKRLLIQIYSNNVRNNKEELLSLLKKKNNEMQEGYPEWSDLQPSTWNVNGKRVGIDFFVREYDKWNHQGGSIGYREASKASVLEFLQNNYEDFSNNEKLKKELYWALTDRDLLNEDDNGQIKYGALMLFLDVPIWKKITSVIKKEDIYEKNGEFGIETEPHVTILYGFHDKVTADEVFDLYKEKFDLKPIEIGIEGISTFENQEFDVVKMDVESEILGKMNAVMRELPNTTKYPKYHAHITLAYVKKGKGKDYVKKFEKKRMMIGDELVFSTKKEKQKKMKLTEKGMLKEELKKVNYSAVVLDNKSHNKLVQVFRPMIPEGWEVIAHHMTIKMGALENGSKEKQDMENGIEITLKVIDYAIDNLVMAVGVEGYPTTNTKPHITIAVNRTEGGKPFLSNKLTDWKPLGFPLTLTGKVNEE